MKAVNLIPAEQRRGSTGPGQSGIGVYALLGGLAALVIGVGAYVVVSNSLSSDRDKLASVTREANETEARAAALKPYRDFATLSQQRRQTVASLASSRFDWESAIRQVSRVLPSNVWLTSFVGTVAPGITFDSSLSPTPVPSHNKLRDAQPVPAFELIGCTTSQSEVSRVMATLRRIKGVSRVALAESVKIIQPTAGASSGGGQNDQTQDCRYNDPKLPRFDIIAYFAPLTGASPGTPTPGSPAGPPASTAQPVSGGSGAQTTPSQTNTTSQVAAK